ncbi:MAG: FHA domain-containing protein [Clostridiales Family XIII bacterium]|jgi:hypothetical protein|nr:FHA domain-containing protein [Clostridiales Family XIII bacterium]
MLLTKCSNGHFYDAEKFTQCPHCGSQGGSAGDQTVSMDRNDSVTVSLTQGDMERSAPRTEASVSEGVSSLKEAVQKAAAGGAAASSDGDSVTMSYYSKSIGAEPVVGWLVCIEGSHLGEDFRLKSGRNFIGRASGMDIAVTGDNTVSREKHAVIVYEPKKHRFLVQPGEAKELCYLNEKAVLSPEELTINDTIALGNTKLMFFPCCGDAFNWDMVKAEEKEA